MDDEDRKRLRKVLAAHLNIDGDNILDPCPPFPQGIRVGDRIRVVDDSDEEILATVADIEAWSKYERRSNFTDVFGLCAKDDGEGPNDFFYYRNDWEELAFVERPTPAEASGQLLMF